MSVIAHDDVFPQGTPDTVWLTRAGQEGWIVLTKDQAIRYSEAELSALQRARVREFVLASGNLTSTQMAEAFIVARSAMESIAMRIEDPFIARVTRDGRVSRVRVFRS